VLASHGARLAGLLLLAAAVRVWIALQPGLGHDSDLGLFVRWMRGLHHHGLGGFYAAERFCDYPPLMLLALRGLAASLFAVFQDPSDHVLRAGLKLLVSCGDLAVGLLLVYEGRKLLGRRAGILAGGLYLLNPVALYDSAYWGQVDSMYTALLVTAFVLLRHRHWGAAGVAGALGLAAKFQSIALLPLLFLEAYRLAGWRGLSRAASGGVIAAAVVAAPYVVHGTFSEMVDRAYVGVVGQYHALSNNAFNVWYLVANPGTADTSPPEVIVRAVAQGRPMVEQGESWLLRLTWRKISLALFALAVAIVLSLYARRPGPLAIWGAGGLLALCFYLFPSEMHERYAYPAIAFLAPWAAARASNERLYWGLTIGLLLNLTAVLPAGGIAPQIAAVHLVIFATILTGLFLTRSPIARASIPRTGGERETAQAVEERQFECGSRFDAGARPDAWSAPSSRPDGSPLSTGRPLDDTSAPVGRLPGLIRAFQVMTAFAAGLAILSFTLIHLRARAHTDVPRTTDQRQASATAADQGGHFQDVGGELGSSRGHLIWLADLEPRAAQQGWRSLGRDKAADGGVLRIGARFYLQGIGTHAPAKLVYEAPPGAHVFEAIAGIDQAGSPGGSAIVRIEVDGDLRYESPVLTCASGPAGVRVPMAGARTLTILVDPTSDGQRSDHVDLALARFETNEGSPASRPRTP